MQSEVNEALRITKVTRCIGFAAMPADKRLAAQSKGGRNVPSDKRSFAVDPASAIVAGKAGQAAAVDKLVGSRPFCNPDAARAGQAASTRQRLLLRGYGETIIATGKVSFAVESLRFGSQKVNLLQPLTINGEREADHFALSAQSLLATGKTIAAALANLARIIFDVRPDELRDHLPARYFTQ